jgi:SpoVK/Ycf46/Vps4 family AAA+-type ATPase
MSTTLLIYNFTGFQFVRGVILYGPPRTGKTTLVKYVIQLTKFFSLMNITLFYRTLCEYFKLEPRIVNSRQLLSSIVGKSEEAVRLLFQQAIEDQKTVSGSYLLRSYN